MLRLLAVLLTIAFVTVGGGASRAQIASVSANPEYLVGAFDGLRIDVQGEPELSTELSVRPDGRISIPLVDDVPAAGRTPTDIARDLEKRLSAYLRNPVVTVMVTRVVGDSSQTIYVIGAASVPDDEVGRAAVVERQVTTPRSVNYRRGITLIDVIDAVGGLSIYAAGNSAYISRRKGDSTISVPVRLDDLIDNGDTTANVLMEPGDTLVIPLGAFSGQWRLEPSIGVFFTATDNFGLVQSNLKDPAIIPVVAPGLSLRATTRRFDASLDADVELRYTEIFRNQLDLNEGFDAFVNLLGSSTTEVVNDRMFFDLNAVITQAASNDNQATSLSPFVSTNRSTTASVSASPFLLHRFGDFANGQLLYLFTGVFRNDGDNNITDIFVSSNENTLGNEISYTLTSGTEFEKFRWLFDARARNITRSTRDDENRVDVSFGGSYPINRSLDVTGSIGYQRFRDGTSNDFDAISWTVGVDYHPSPNLNASLSIGQQDDRESLRALVIWDISERSRFDLSYSQSFSSSEQAFADLVSGLRRNSAGETVRLDGQPLNIASQGFDFNQATQFRRTFSAGFTTIQGPNTFSLTTSAILRTTEPENIDENTYTVDGTWTRAFNRLTRGELALGYAYRDTDVDDNDTYSVRVRVDRTLVRDLEGFISYGFQHRESTLPIRDFTENVVAIGLTRRF